MGVSASLSKENTFSGGIYVADGASGKGSRLSVSVFALCLPALYRIVHW